MAERPRVIAVVGMTSEARIIAGDGVTVVIGGGDSAGLERKLEAALDLGAASPWLLSFGVCGALSPDLKAGDLVIGSCVLWGERRRPTDAAWTSRLAEALPKARLADIAASDTMIASVAEKGALHEATGAAAVDMESHIVARLAERYALPFAVVRAVSDAADHTLPSAALAGLKPDGSADIFAVLRSLAAQPRQLVGLIRIARDAGAALQALKTSVEAVLGSMPPPPPHERPAAPDSGP